DLGAADHRHRIFHHGQCRGETPVTRPILIKNARLIDPAKDKGSDGAILFADKILDVGAVTSAPDGAEIIDADGAHVSPGLIDMRGVIGEPGAEHKEACKSAGR